MSSNHEYVQTKYFYDEENKKPARRKKNFMLGGKT
jgi:hypothetical protein